MSSGVGCARCGVRVVRYLCTVAPRAGIAADAQRWDIFAGVALLRHPIIAPPMTDAEQRYANVRMRIEERESLMSDFELKHIKDTKLLAKRAQLEAEGKELSALDEEIGLTAEVQREEWARTADTLRRRFAIGDISKVEENSDRSLKRKLHEKLLLVVRQKFARSDGYYSPWILPQLANRIDENLKQTAERCLYDVVEGTVHASVSSNAPFSMYSYRYPPGLSKNTSSESVGAKVFFFSASISPQSECKVNSEEIVDYKWITAKEFSKLIRSKTYRNSISSLFLK
ncbi:unnamed protein product [Toxocara canis]|uniref:39S ribosomal protein L46, mitochondrial n=1 Tax=Toxocara canis TaxID=6265 RepID=A0A183UT54_TOXCA|nr:unnamed protein product [Toxocara canis]